MENNQLLERYREKSSRKYVLAGVVILFLCYLFFLLRGENISVVMHDQLDSDVSYLVLKSETFRSLFQTEFSQFMNGNADISVAAFGSLFFYLFLPPIYAFITNMFFVRMVAFCGLFYLLRECNVERPFSFGAAIAFAFLPIYSVYGLCSMGVPFLCLSVKHIIDGKKRGYFGIAVYGLFSSLVLIGFVLISIMCVYTIVCFVKKEKRWKQLLNGDAELLLIYVLFNWDLLKSVLSVQGSFVSHKIDYKLASKNFYEVFNDMLFNGHYHSASLHKFIIISVIVAIVLSLFNLKRIKREKNLSCKLKLLIIDIAFIIAITAFCALFKSEIGVEVRTKLFDGSALLGFQFDRGYWLYPALWYILFGISLSLIFNLLCEGYLKIRVILVFVLWLIPTLFVLKNSDVIQNGAKYFMKCDMADTWAKQYDERLYSEIGSYIARPKNEYRVVSVGLEPNVALYNGFYCLDGYSNNYDLDYKNQFGKAINGELQKNSRLYDYYWDWGNRCYLFSAELDGNTYISKELKKTVDLDLDIDALRDMGCDFILSGVSIGNADDLKLTFERYFEHESSYYGIYLYSVAKNDKG